MYNINLTETQLISNYNELLEFVNFFGDERKEKILQMYKDLETQIITSPCSTMNVFHGAFPGGYVVHVLNVIKNSIEMYKLWKKMGANIDGFTQEELIFSAMFHDLGKIGEKGKDCYIMNESEWHRKNQGKLFTQNPELQYMLHEDRSLYLLQKYGITISNTEYIAIRTHNGIFIESNKWYWQLGTDKSQEFKNVLPIILHYADYMSYRIECEKEGIFKK
jgi:hypothetical protein